MNAKKLSDIILKKDIAKSVMAKEEVVKCEEVVLNEHYASNQFVVIPLNHRLCYNHSLKMWIIYDHDQKRWRYDKHDLTSLAVRAIVEDTRSSLQQKLKSLYKKRSHLKKSEKKSNEVKELDKQINNLEFKLKFITGLGNKAKLSNIIDLAKGNMPIDLELLNAEKDAVVVKNGVVNLHSGEFSDKEDDSILLFDSHQIQTEYNETAECPLWLKFLEQITGGDRELELYLQVLVGYLMTGETHEQQFYFIHGLGSNGKGVFLDVLRELLSDYVATLDPTALMENKFNTGGKPTPELMALADVRLSIVSEGEEGSVLNLSLIKLITGENEISLRAMYNDEQKVKTQSKLVFETNYLPIIKENEHATWRRIVVIPFLFTVAKNDIDKDLREKLLVEKEGILLWCIQGAQEYYENGIPECTAVTKATTQYRNFSDPFRAFMNQYVSTKSGEKIVSSKLHNLYKIWCEEQDISESKIYSPAKFSPEVVKLGYEKKRSSSGVKFLDCHCSYEEPVDAGIEQMTMIHRTFEAQTYSKEQEM